MLYQLIQSNDVYNFNFLVLVALCSPWWTASLSVTEYWWSRIWRASDTHQTNEQMAQIKQNNEKEQAVGELWIIKLLEYGERSDVSSTNKSNKFPIS